METTQERAEIREALPKEEAAAKERKESGANQYTEGSGKFPEGSKGRTRDKVAEAREDIARYLNREFVFRCEFVGEMADEYPGVRLGQLVADITEYSGGRWAEALAEFPADIDPVDGLPAKGKYLFGERNMVLADISPEEMADMDWRRLC